MLPTIAFQEMKGKYLSLKGAQNIPISLINVNKITVTITKVFENNIQRLMDSGSYYDYHYDEGTDEYYDFQSYDTENLGKEIFKKEYATSALTSRGPVKILHLDFSDELKDFQGVYILKIEDKDHLWLNSSRILSLSDLGLICKKGLHNLYVYVHSINTAKSLEGVKINFISNNNQRLASAKTDKDGLAILDEDYNKFKDWEVSLISAENGADYNFLMLDPNSEINNEHFDLKGKKINKTGYDAYIYAERNLYRPGEEVHIAGQVRDLNWKTPRGLPVELRILMPDQKVLKTMRKNLDYQGAFETSLSLPLSVMTGYYQCEVLTGDNVLLSSYGFSVEEFMPDRIKLGLSLDKLEYDSCDDIDVSLKAENFFGTPAINRNYNIELSVKKGVFSPAGYENFSFNGNRELGTTTIIETGQTDASGQAIKRLALPSRWSDGGILNGSVLATVFDESGRPVSLREYHHSYPG